VLRQSGDTEAIYVGAQKYREVDGSYWDLDTRLAWMDGYGIERQVVSPLPVLLTYWAPLELARAFCGHQNEAIARFVAAAPDRLVGFGTVPLQDPAAAAEELEHVQSLGLAGVEIGTRAGERELDAPGVIDFFRAAGDLELSVLVHAQEAAGLGRMDDPLVRFGLGVPVDAGIALARLLLSGLTDEIPRLRIAVCHGGGTFFWSLPRLEPMVHRLRGEEASARLRRALASVYVDSASLGTSNIEYLLGLVSPDRLLLGSDYPATMEMSPIAAWNAPSLEQARPQALADNACRYLQR
jgi:aminocarboxymuconate-semialdehyde decarboxylase